MAIESQNELYEGAVAAHGPAIGRLARAYEADTEIRRDLLQEIHVALWRSFEAFDGRCSLRTWVYRVAHNTAASHVLRERRFHAAAWVTLEEAEAFPNNDDTEGAAEQKEVLERLLALIRRLEPLDRRVILSYLEGMDAASIGEDTGISARNAATKIHRIKNILAHRFHEGGRHGE